MTRSSTGSVVNKMHQIHFRLGLHAGPRPGPHWGAHNAPQTPKSDGEGYTLPLDLGTFGALP